MESCKKPEADGFYHYSRTGAGGRRLCAYGTGHPYLRAGGGGYCDRCLAPHGSAAHLAAALGVALGRMQATYGTTDPAQFRRIHNRDDVCALADPLVGPCMTMPHQDRGSWLKIVGFVSKP